jgi:hypothetical protein
VTHRFHPEALDEWHAAGLRYEDEREGLGVEFASAIRAAVGVVMIAPLRWPPFTRNTRAYRLDRFPYRTDWCTPFSRGRTKC